MKEFYNLKVSWMNGTVTMVTEVSSYPTEEMAKEVEKVVLEKNKDNCYRCLTLVEKGYLYESLDEVPIMSKKSKKNE